MLPGHYLREVFKVYVVLPGHYLREVFKVYVVLPGHYLREVFKVSLEFLFIVLSRSHHLDS